MMEIRNKIYVWEKFRRTYKLSKEGEKTKPFLSLKLKVSPHRLALVKQLSQLIPEVPPMHTQTAKVPFRITPLPSSSKNHHRMSRETKLHSFCLGAFPGQWSTDRIAACDFRVRKREEAGQKGWPAAGEASIPSGGNTSRYLSCLPVGTVMLNTPSILHRTAQPTVWGTSICILLSQFVWLLSWSAWMESHC